MRRSCSQLITQSIAQKHKQSWPASVSRLLNRVHTNYPSNGEWWCRTALPNRIYGHNLTLQVRVRKFASIPENGGPTFENEPDNRSLNQRIHHVLRIPFGRMNESNLQQARSFLFIVSRYKNEQGAKLSEALLERLFSERSMRATVDTEMYNACINAWNTSCADGKLVVNNVESIFARMEQRCNDKSNPHATMARPDRTTYNSVLNCYSKCKEDNAFKVHALLDKMNDIAAWEDHYDADEYALKVMPDEITYNSVMNYYASRNNEHYAAQQVESILLKMSELAQQPGSNIRISSTSFNIAIKAWSNAGIGLDGAERSKALLLMMMKWRDKGHDVEPTAISFSTVIDAYSKVSREHATTAIDNAMELLDMMEASSITDLDHINSCYNAAANVLIKMGVEKVGEKVRQLMLRMKNMDASPDEFMFVRCIEAYAKETNRDDRVYVANELFEEMVQQLGCNPSSLAFNSLLNILVKANTDEGLDLAEQLLERMHSLGGDSRPDIASYSMIISALSRNSSTNSENKAVDYLRRMLRSYNVDHYMKAKPNSLVFNIIINMLDRSNDEMAGPRMYNTLMSMENQHRQGNESVFPDTITYNTVIAKLAKSPTKENAKKVMKLLAQMQRHEESGNTGVSPDIITYTSVLKLQEKLDPNRAASIASTYLRRVLTKKELPPIDKVGLRALLIPLSRRSEPEDAKLALRIWERIECCSRTSKVLDPDLCNLVAMSLSRAKYDDSADTVLNFLSERFRRLKAGDETVVLPTVIGMNAVLSSLASKGRMNCALSIIDIARLLGKKCHQLQPDAGCYRSILVPLAVDRSSTKNAWYVEKISKRAKDDFGVIPISILNAAIDACAYTLEDEGGSRAEAIKVAFGLFDQAKEAGTYNTATFGLLIKACMKLTDDESVKFKLVQRLFHLCAKSGMVGEMVLNEIKPLQQKLLPNNHVPLEWTLRATNQAD